MNRSNPFSPNNPPAGGPGAPPPTGTPDTQWSSVFGDASEAPPARVWNGIERQLDLDDEDGVLPLYPQGVSRSVLFGRWLAGVAAACLLALFGWWALRSQPVTPSVDNTVTMTRSAGQSDRKDHSEAIKGHYGAGTNVLSRQNATEKGDYAYHRSRKKGQISQHEHTAPAVANDTQPAENLAIDLAPVALAQPHTTVEIIVTESIAVTRQSQPITRSMPTNEQSMHAFAQTRSSFLTQNQFVQPSLSKANGDAIIPPTAHSVLPASASTGHTLVVLASVVNQAAIDPLTALQAQLASTVQPMTIRPFAPKITGNERIVWFSPEQPETVPTQKTAHKARARAWVSAGVVASSFNPNVALRPVSGLAYTTNSPTNTLVTSGPLPALALDSRAGRAIAVQANVGIPLSDRWTLETGVGYLTGQSTVQSPVRTTALAADRNNNTANYASLYTDLIVGGTSSAANYDVNNQFTSTIQRTALVANSSYDRSVSQSVGNDYQFVQVPVQMSYELRPRRKFGLALLTGMVSNLFVRNTVDGLTVKGQDNVYKPLTLAGTAGMRLRFRPDKQWSASVAGLFHQSFQSITRADVGVQAVPQSMGVSFSVDRQF